MTRWVPILALVAVAVAVAFAVTMGASLLGHEFLVLTVGEAGIPAIDDTPLMFAVVAVAYLAGGLAGLAVIAFGWTRFLRRRT